MYHVLCWFIIFFHSLSMPGDYSEMRLPCGRNECRIVHMLLVKYNTKWHLVGFLFHIELRCTVNHTSNWANDICCYNQIFIIKPYSAAVTLHFSNMKRSDCGNNCLRLPTQPPSQCLLTNPPRRVKQPVQQADHSLPYIDKVKRAAMPLLVLYAIMVCTQTTSLVFGSFLFCAFSYIRHLFNYTN